jgi:hypothetical protein
MKIRLPVKPFSLWHWFTGKLPLLKTPWKRGVYMTLEAGPPLRRYLEFK